MTYCNHHKYLNLSSITYSSLPKMNMTEMLKSASSAGAIDLSEVQDFSMPSKKSSVHAALSSAFPSMGSKSKLDDTLNKLMKKNNCVSSWQGIRMSSSGTDHP